MQNKSINRISVGIASEMVYTDSTEGLLNWAGSLATIPELCEDAKELSEGVFNDMFS